MQVVETKTVWLPAFFKISSSDEFTFMHLADAFIQSYSQKRNKLICQRANNIPSTQCQVY